jgi:hypothetical protein
MPERGCRGDAGQGPPRGRFQAEVPRRAVAWLLPPWSLSMAPWAQWVQTDRAWRPSDIVWSIDGESTDKRLVELTRLLRLPGGFPVEQSAPAFDAPGIPRKRTVIADHAVARNGDGKIVRRARASDRAHSLGRADTLCNLGIGSCLANRDFLERLPYALLESRAADVERKIEADPWGLNQPDNPRNQAS